MELDLKKRDYLLKSLVSDKSVFLSDTNVLKCNFMKTISAFFSAIIIITIFSCRENSKNSEVNVDSKETLYFNGTILTMEGDSPQYAESIVVS